MRSLRALSLLLFAAAFLAPPPAAAALRFPVFAAPQVYGPNAPTNHVVIADVTGDGRSDAITATAADGWAGEYSLQLFRQLPEGTLAPPVTYLLPPSSGYLAPGDFDGDGKTDLAVATSEGIAIFYQRD